MGGSSVMALLLALITMVGAGLFSVDVDGIESGPLGDRISFEAGRQAAHIHGFVFNLLLGLVGLHVAAILFYRLRLKQDLILPMVTGRAPDEGLGEGAGPVALWRLLVGVVLAGALVWAASRSFWLPATE